MVFWQMQPYMNFWKSHLTMVYEIGIPRGCQHPTGIYFLTLCKMSHLIVFVVYINHVETIREFPSTRKLPSDQQEKFGQM